MIIIIVVVVVVVVIIIITIIIRVQILVKSVIQLRSSLSPAIWCHESIINPLVFTRPGSRAIPSGKSNSKYWASVKQKSISTFLWTDSLDI